MAMTYLDAQETKMKEEINKVLQDTKNFHLQCDGLNNIRNESVTNFVISKPEISTFFYISRRKYWFRANFRFPVFNGFTRFGMS